MKPLFSSFDQSANSAPIALLRRCLQSLQFVATTWTLGGIVIMSLAHEVPVSSPMHPKLQMLSIGSILVGAGLYSVVVPIYFILRRSEAR
jgi:hypothetical protein